MSIDEAKEEFDFFNEGDYITREMSIAKDIVLQELENTKADLYEANNRIADLLLILGDRDRMIDLMADDLVDDEKYIEDLADFEYFPKYKTKEEAINYYEKECKNAND